ncbi:MAG: hypothetical protein RIT81_19525 [Deltaproteobacteria bacterium]
MDRLAYFALLTLAACGGTSPFDGLDGTQPTPGARAADCSIDGTHAYVFALGPFIAQCEAGSVESMFERASDGTLDVTYDAALDEVHVVGPFGAKLERAEVVLKATPDAADRYVGERSVHIQNPYDARFDPMRYAFRVELPRHLVSADTCQRQMTVLPTVGFPGGFWCDAPVDVYLEALP